MAMALPFTYMMTPLASMVFLGGIYAGGVFGGSISSILINIPGTPASLPSLLGRLPDDQARRSRRGRCRWPSPRRPPAASSARCC
jgi:putative tricarboxylic transport membrane protein